MKWLLLISILILSGCTQIELHKDLFEPEIPEFLEEKEITIDKTKEIISKEIDFKDLMDEIYSKKIFEKIIVRKKISIVNNSCSNP